jgi:hypothetical protein
MAKLSSLKIGIISGTLSGLIIISAGFYLTHNTNHDSSRVANLSSVNTSNKQLVLGDSTTNSQSNNQPTSQPDTSTSQSSSQPKHIQPTSTAAPSTTTKPKSAKPAPTITGIAVITSTPGANETIYIPFCDFGSISSGTPMTCNHYKPIPFNRVKHILMALQVRLPGLMPL